MRRWETEIHIQGETDGMPSVSTRYGSFNLLQARHMIENTRRRDGTPRRKIRPVSVYIFEEMIRKYFAEYESEESRLEKIIVRYSNEEL